MSDEPPDSWRREHSRRYTLHGRDRPMEYRTYVHESGDLRLRIAPDEIDGGGRPGYTLRVRVDPELETASSIELRHVLTFDRCVSVANRFMALFSAVYDGPGDLEDALEYAARRVGDPDRALALEVGRDDG